MEKIIGYLSLHPVIFFFAIVFSLVIVFAFLKRVVHVMLVVAAFLVLYAAYIMLAGGHIPEVFHTLEQWFVNLFRFLTNLLVLLLKLPKKEFL